MSDINSLNSALVNERQVTFSYFIILANLIRNFIF